MQKTPAEAAMPSRAQSRSGSNDAERYFVVGSGPAGVACAKALLERGKKVHVLDAGVTLEPERVKLVEKLGRNQPEEWLAADLIEYQKGMNPDVGGVPLKLVYGSDFAYRHAGEHLGVHYDEVGLRPSFAQGGLSNVWGAAMMPFRKADIMDWPLKFNALAEHYSAVLRFTGLAARHDALEEFFPLETNNLTELRISRQAQQLLTRMEKHRAALADQGIHFGSSRLAVRGNHSTESGGCVYCRLCMYGCPYGFIYNSQHTLKDLQANAKFTYEPGVIVTSVSESERGVEISGHELSTRLPRAWQGDRVFLAAGAIPTTRILLQSLAAYDRPVWLRDSQYFLLPLALTRRSRGVRHERLHALSQLFIEIMSANGEGKTAHVQIYSHSDLVAQAVGKAFGPLKRPLEVLVRNLEERLLVAQGFLHSDYGSRIAASLKKDASTGAERLELRAELNPNAKPAVKKVMHLFLKNSRLTGAIPLAPMLRIAGPGRSFHCGGSFPMSNNPGELQTDLLGRPAGWTRLHAVDATIFPSVPATTITLSVMANAHRIGWEAAGMT